MTIEIDGVNNTLKTDKIEPQSGTALQVGASGDTITLPSGATLNIAGTITNSGTATGFGAVDWQTSDIKTSTFTAVAGKGYLVNTTGGAITVNLPAGSAGAQIALADYAGTWDSNNCTVAANGSEKIQSSTDDAIFSRDREALQILYVDSTQGWLITSVADQGGTQASYITASGGTETTSGDYKIHTFTGSGTFTVSSVGNAAGSTTVDYLIVAGGGGGGKHQAGGGGAGGLRKNYPNPATTGTPVTATAYPVVIGAGGTGQTSGTSNAQGGDGVASSAFSVSSAGGGGGGGYYNPGCPGGAGRSGGSGGGAGSASNTSGSATTTPASTAGTGNTPPVSPSQGNPGGLAWDRAPHGSGGGGGHGAVGGSGPGSGAGGLGGCGTSVAISGSATVYAGGGGASSFTAPSTAPANGGGGGDGGHSGPGSETPGAAGTANTGGGGGGGASSCKNGGNGGSGLVVISYKYQN